MFALLSLFQAQGRFIFSSVFASACVHACLIYSVAVLTSFVFPPRTRTPPCAPVLSFLKCPSSLLSSCFHHQLAPFIHPTDVRVALITRNEIFRGCVEWYLELLSTFMLRLLIKSYQVAHSSIQVVLLCPAEFVRFRFRPLSFHSAFYLSFLLSSSHLLHCNLRSGMPTTRLFFHKGRRPPSRVVYVWCDTDEQWSKHDGILHPTRMRAQQG
jgi:hypothetical protein